MGLADAPAVEQHAVTDFPAAWRLSTTVPAKSMPGIIGKRRTTERGR
jgi:hypothetical protein